MQKLKTNWLTLTVLLFASFAFAFGKASATSNMLAEESTGQAKVKSGIVNSLQFTCTDSDNGDAPFALGKVYGIGAGGEFIYYDECANENQVREQYCQKYDDGKLLPGNKIVDCAYGCKEGACVINQMNCTNDYIPVCGADGKIYSNKCVAEQRHGVKVAYEGECKGKVECFVQCLRYDPVCGADGKTYACGEADAICRGTTVAYQGECKSASCTKEYRPVCGNDGKTYDNVCQADAFGLGVYYDGACKKYRFSSWVCYDGTKQTSDDPTSCKDLVTWKKYAAEFCDGKCSSDTGKCGVNSFEVDRVCGAAEEIAGINKKAELLSNNRLDDILKELNELRSIVKEQQTQIKYLLSLVKDSGKLTQAMQNSINSFITYGVDENTKKLGEGERAAVMYSYRNAYGKLPEDESDLADAIKIANGRWPAEKSASAENKAMSNFKKIYQREPNLASANDNAAVTVMAYGLRQKAKNRNLESEKNGQKIFKDIFKRVPQNTEDWNIVQAITYSGAKK